MHGKSFIFKEVRFALKGLLLWPHTASKAAEADEPQIANDLRPNGNRLHTKFHFPKFKTYLIESDSIVASSSLRGLI